MSKREMRIVEVMKTARRFNSLVRLNTEGQYLVYACNTQPRLFSHAADAIDHLKTTFYQTQGAFW